MPVNQTGVFVLIAQEGYAFASAPCLRMLTLSGERMNAGAVNWKALKVRPQKENEPSNAQRVRRCFLLKSRQRFLPLQKDLRELFGGDTSRKGGIVLSFVVVCARAIAARWGEPVGSPFPAGGTRKGEAPLWGLALLRGAPGGDRTHNLQRRRLTRYPIALRVHLPFPILYHTPRKNALYFAADMV